jgi:hypothetical protein
MSRVQAGFQLLPYLRRTADGCLDWRLLVDFSNPKLAVELATRMEVAADPGHRRLFHRALVEISGADLGDEPGLWRRLAAEELAGLRAGATTPAQAVARVRAAGPWTTPKPRPPSPTTLHRRRAMERGAEFLASRYPGGAWRLLRLEVGGGRVPDALTYGRGPLDDDRTRWAETRTLHLDTNTGDLAEAP